MKSFSRTVIVAWAIVAVASVAPASAEVLMLDFGPTLVSGAHLPNSPYHTVDGSFTDTVWNGVQIADVAAGGLFYSDGTEATGVALDLGTTAVGGTTINLANNPVSSNALGTNQNAGVFGGTSVGRDAIWNGSPPAAEPKGIGAQISGLEAGTYHVYVVSRNTSNDLIYQEHIFAGAGAAGADFDVAGAEFASSVIEYLGGNNSVVNAWVQNENYARLTVTLNEGDALNLGVTGAAGNLENRGFFNAVQIVPTVALVPGDFDGDGDVDGADFVAWQTNFPKAENATLAEGDADGDGDVDGADFVVWQTNFPFTPGPGVASAPEPAAGCLLLVGVALALAAARNRAKR